MELKHVKAIEVGDIVTLFEREEYIEYMKQLDIEINEDNLHHVTPDGISIGETLFKKFAGKTFEIGTLREQSNSKVFRVITDGKLIPYWLSAYQVKSVSSPNENIIKLIIN